MKELLDSCKAKRPDFAGNIKGASDEEINELEGLVGKKLDEDYKIFLKYLGNGSGEMFTGQVKVSKDKASYTMEEVKYDFTVETVMKHYRWLTGKKKRGNKKIELQNRFSQSFVFIGTQKYSQDHGSYYLDYRAAGKPAVVNIDEFNEVFPLAASLKDFVLTYAFEHKYF